MLWIHIVLHSGKGIKFYICLFSNVSKLHEGASLLSKVIPSTFPLLFLTIILLDASSVSYRGLLGQHGLCYNTNTWPSFSKFQAFGFSE